MYRRFPTMTSACVACMICLFLIAPSLFAQEYPTRPINVLVGLGPGAPQDVTFRMLASKAEKFLGQPIVVSNNGGAGGTVALGITAKEKPDGYHLVVCGNSFLVMTPLLRQTAYKPQDFVPIMHFGVGQQALAVKGDSPWKTLKDFVDYAKKNPGKVTYGSLDKGSLVNMAMDYIAKQEGIRWTLISYTGGGTATIALLGGHIAAESGASSLFPHARAGTVRLLATYGPKRMKSFPQVPTLQESGYDCVIELVYMVAAPKGTPPAVVKKLDDAFRKAMDDPEFIQTMDKLDVEVKYRNSEEMKKFLEESHTRFSKMVKDFNLVKEGDKK